MRICAKILMRQEKFPTDALECAAAVKYVRDNAEKFDIDPDKIIVCGFSAGGHLAATMANFWNSELLTKPLGCNPEDIKVNGSILGYPVITSDPEYTHEGSILNIIGEENHRSSENLFQWRREYQRTLLLHLSGTVLMMAV